MWNVVLHSFEEPPHLSVLTTFYRCSTLYVWIVFTNSKPIKKMWLKWNWFLWSMSTFTIPTNTSIFTDQVSLKNAIGQTLIEAANAFSTKGWNKLHDFAQIFSLQNWVDRFWQNHSVWWSQISLASKFDSIPSSRRISNMFDILSQN